MRSFRASLTVISVIAAISLAATAAPAPVAELNARHFNSQEIKQLGGASSGIAQAATHDAAEQSATASNASAAVAVSIANEAASPAAAAALPVASLPSVVARYFDPFKALESLSLGLIPPSETSAYFEEIVSYVGQMTPI